jgi:outer membrane protein OmpA-like peptidoglycan-associated protein
MKRIARLLALALLTTSLAACGGSQSTSSSSGSSSGASSSGSSSDDSSATTARAAAGGSSAGVFQLSESTTAAQARGEHPSQITATATHAAMRLFVVDPDAGPTAGVVIKLTGPDGRSYYTDETDAQGYAEVLVPAGQRYELEYLSLGRRTTSAHVDVPAGPNQDIRLTLRYRRWRPPPRPVIVPREPAPTPAEPMPEPEPEGLVLEGILFETGSATLDPASIPRLDRVVEYMTHRPSVRIRISGHTDNVGNPQRNLALSQARAEAVRAYLVANGIDAGRVEAVGFGDTRPVAPNDTEAGRQQNRRIEATEL